MKSVELGRWVRFKAPIGIGAMHREYEILCHLNGTPNKDNTQDMIDNEESYYVAVNDLIASGLIERDTGNWRVLSLTIPGREVLRLCHEEDKR